MSGSIAFIPFSDLWFSLGCSICLVIFAVIIGKAAKEMEREEFKQFISGVVMPSIGTSYPRITVVLMFLIGLFGFVISIYEMVMFFLNA